MISIRKLKVVYRPRGIEAIRDVTIEIPENRVTCIVGPNASGKTTLLRAIAALVDYEGSVLVSGVEARKALKMLRRILSYTPGLAGTGDYLGATVFDVLVYSRYPVSKGFADQESDVEEVYRVARILGIEHLLDRKLGELSSGELQRVILACALVKNPRVLLLDEPDSHLDASYKTWLSGFLREISTKTTVVITTHDTVFASSVCDYVVIISGGSVVYTGTMEELINNPGYLEKAYGVCFAVASAGGRKILVPAYGNRGSCSTLSSETLTAPRGQ